MQQKHLRKAIATPLAIVGGFVLLITGAIAAETKIEGKEGMTCLNLSSIQQTKVISDSAILFRMRDGRYYVNELPFSCSGLKFEDGFSYSTSTAQLCGNVEIITVLRRGTSCGLGAFKEVTEAQGKMLSAGKSLEEAMNAGIDRVDKM
jgi:hypothetical protein